MNEIFTSRKAGLLISLLLLLFVSCEKEATKSVYDENPTVKPDPVITSIEPPVGALAGIGTVTINGSNFSPNPVENAVFFGSTPATVVSASESEMVVQTPNILADSLEVKVSVVGALLFSNVMYYTLEPAVEEYGGYGVAGEDLYAIAADTAENVYVFRSIRFIDIITPDSSNSAQPYGTSAVVTTGMKMGPGGYLYLAKNNTTLRRIPPGGGSQTTFSTLPHKIFDLDFDPAGNIYAAGDSNVTVVYSDGTFEAVAEYPGTLIRAVRVYDNYVYFAGNGVVDSLRVVWRNQINAPNDLGPNELVFDLTPELGKDIEVQSLTFAEDGDMYIGTTAAPDPIVVVHPGGSYELLYPGILAPEMYDMAWGNDVYLYVTRRASALAQTETRILRINMQKRGAPYYGRQ